MVVVSSSAPPVGASGSIDRSVRVVVHASAREPARRQRSKSFPTTAGARSDIPTRSWDDQQPLGSSVLAETKRDHPEPQSTDRPARSDLECRANFSTTPVSAFQRPVGRQRDFAIGARAPGAAGRIEDQLVRLTDIADQDLGAGPSPTGTAAGPAQSLDWSSTVPNLVQGADQLAPKSSAAQRLATRSLYTRSRPISHPT
jgi:hypothetical protein